jgi:hypothetical protein
MTYNNISVDIGGNGYIILPISRVMFFLNVDALIADKHSSSEYCVLKMNKDCQPKCTLFVMSALIMRSNY